LYSRISIYIWKDQEINVSTSKKHDAKAFRDELRKHGVRPLIKHRILNPLDHDHNARMDGDRYHQRSMSETVFSSIKRTLGSAVRARSWWLELREMLLKATIYNLHRSVQCREIDRRVPKLKSHGFNFTFGSSIYT